jgi:hypothetical protein
VRVAAAHHVSRANMRRLDLVADCGSCAAVCCVVLPFDASEDFAFEKPAGVACRHLQSDRRCAIHDRLVERGLSGCAVYECYGAGPRVTRAFTPAERHEAFLVLRVIHELLWLLTEAAKLLPPSHEVRATLAGAIEALDVIAARPFEDLVVIDVERYREHTHKLLRRVGDALDRRDRVRLVVL